MPWGQLAQQLNAPGSCCPFLVPFVECVESNKLPAAPAEVALLKQLASFCVQRGFYNSG